ncbi:hypothetical protein DOP62_14270 (plasmid) [Synechococcus elongatus PCC 11801]|uniref:Uncharacterized protein n=1 Tax=Synechococcus elongatus PCC 11801 TaxID=2219813 RepID=A0ACD5A319_SYNEL
MTESSTPSAPLSLGDLEARYSIARNTLRNRLEGLGIQPQQDGRHRLVSVDDVLLLDDLDAHLKSGGTVGSFLRVRGLAIATVEEPVDSDHDSIDDTVNGGSIIPVANQQGGGQLELLLTAIASVAQTRPASPTERYEFLDKAASAGWSVTTTDLRWATAQSTVKAGQWRDYIFERVGRGLFKVHHHATGKAAKSKKGKS